MTAAWTPGAYIACRRQAAGLSIDAVAAKIGTEPRIDERQRRYWLAAIEADLVPVPADVGVLRAIFAFDPLVLAVLVEIHRDRRDIAQPRLCRSCGCSELDPCLSAAHRACGWVGDQDLCTDCIITAERIPTASMEPRHAS